MELDSAFVMITAGLLKRATELDPLSSVVGKVVVATLAVPFSAVAGKAELRSVDVACFSFEVEVLATIEKMLVRSFAGIKTLLVLSLIGMLVPMAIDEELEFTWPAGTVVAELEVGTDVMSLFGVIVAEIEMTVSVWFMAGVNELGRSLVWMDE